MKLRNIVVMAALCLPAIAFPGIAGKYKFKGVSGQGAPYHGLATIIKAKDAYEARWVYPDGTFEVGTAVRHGDTLSFVFTSVNNGTYGDYGVISYTIEGKTFKGTYCYFASTSVGHEQMKKIKR